MVPQATPLDAGPSGERTQLSRDRVAGEALSLIDSHNIVQLAISYVLGHAIAETGAMQGGRSVQLLSGELLDDPEVAEFVVSGRQLAAPSVFAGGLDVLVAGVRSEYGLA